MTTTGSLITEEMRKAVGEESKAVVYEVEKGAIRKFAQAIDDPNPLWQDEEYAKKHRYGGIVAPPTYCTAFRDEDGLKRYLTMGPLKRILNGGTELEYFQPVRPGDRISVNTKLIDVSEQDTKSGKKLFMIVTQDYKNQKGELVIRGKTTIVKY